MAARMGAHAGHVRPAVLVQSGFADESGADIASLASFLIKANATWDLAR